MGCIAGKAAKAVALDGDALRRASKATKDDKDVVMRAVAADGISLQFASERLRGDKEVVLQAIKEKYTAFTYASHDLRGDKDFVMQAVAASGRSLKYASERLQGDKEVVLQAVAAPELVLLLASKDLRGDRDVVMQAVKAKGSSLEYASADLRGDRDVVMQAIQNSSYGGAFRHASADLRGDKNFVMSALQADGYGMPYPLLTYASKRLRGDKEVVLQAVVANWRSLEHASEHLRGDKKVVMRAISQNGWALQYVADSLKRNKPFGLEAVRRGGQVPCLDKELQNDPDIRRAKQARWNGFTTGNERITFEGVIAQKEGVPCYSSFPGAHAKEWNGLTRKAAAGSVSTACVFLTTNDAGLGRHASPCLCHNIYGQVPAEKYLSVFDKKPNMSDREYEKKLADAKKDSEAMNLVFLERNAYPTEAEWKDAYDKALARAKRRAAENNYVAPWGCFWFALWKAKVEEARKLHQDLVAVYFPGKCGKGKLDWSELADKGKLEQALQDNGLGFSQRAEVAWLEHCGYPVREIDLTTFCQECGLDASTE